MKPRAAVLLAFLCLPFLASCEALNRAIFGPPVPVAEGAPTDPESVWLMLDAAEDALVRIAATEAVKKYAPGLMPLVDTKGLPVLDATGKLVLNPDGTPTEKGDGVVTLAELRAAINPQNQEHITLLVMVGYQLWLDSKKPKP